MPFPTFNPSKPPSVTGISEVVNPRILKAAFGDGYDQSAGDGLNPLVATLSLTWPVMLIEESNIILAFFEERGGHKPFLWSSPLMPNRPRKWKATSWGTATAGTTTHSQITATFEQVFTI